MSRMYCRAAMASIGRPAISLLPWRLATMTLISSSSASASLRVGTGSKPGIRFAERPRGGQEPVLEVGVHLHFEIGDGLSHPCLDPVALRVGESGRGQVAG